jgi:hypothetical protein
VSCQPPQARIIQAPLVLKNVALSRNFGTSGAGAIECLGSSASVSVGWLGVEDI